ncbi:hypothetical protein CDAR_90081 [Caerostris darwini]|uniref:Uncharacterized protein n=1 Tax=Caerostris darwini TaxID=1538125 RepID=A0AAV4QJB9_9ARAC|nr:hypothetical protein CDAR_90081 [Caerostris darwini]
MQVPLMNERSSKALCLFDKEQGLEGGAAISIGRSYSSIKYQPHLLCDINDPATSGWYWLGALVSVL